MRFTLPKDAFPVVKLSRDSQDALICEADTVVKEIVAANEAFIANGAHLDDKHWKVVRAKEGVKVYRQRKRAVNQRGTGSDRPVIQSPTSGQDPSLSRYCFTSGRNLDVNSDQATTFSSSSGVGEESIIEKMRPPGVSMMALHGTVDGTLDDCVFGCVAADNDAWKLRSSHINDKLDDARIITAIRGPTHHDPFRFLGIKWFAKEHPAVLAGTVHQRDFLIIESSGFMRDSTGERLGYFLMHSITLREIPELSHLGIIRGLMSFCFLFRQGGPGKVVVYSRGFFDSRGEMPGRLSVAIAADAALCVVNLVDYAYIKKLRWLINTSGKQNQRQLVDADRPSHCEACSKSFTKFSLTSFGSGTACRICHRVVCTKCSVSKKMTIDVSETGAVQQCSLHFCLSCLMVAKQQSSWEIALNFVDTSSESFVSSNSSSALGSPSSSHKGCQCRVGRCFSSSSSTHGYQRGESATTISVGKGTKSSVSDRAPSLPSSEEAA